MDNEVKQFFLGQIPPSLWEALSVFYDRGKGSSRDTQAMMEVGRVFGFDLGLNRGRSIDWNLVVDCLDALKPDWRGIECPPVHPAKLHWAERHLTKVYNKQQFLRAA